jgi:5-formyltetrahydrofolate cyclo-ligase
MVAQEHLLEGEAGLDRLA